MPKVTRIKAKDPVKKDMDSDATAITRKKVVVKDKKTEKNKRKEKKLAEKKVSVENKKTTEKKPFVLWRPVVYLWRYLKESWGELRQVRWPNRKATWKMVVAVLIYTVVFVVLISLLDLLFKWLFGLVLGS